MERTLCPWRIERKASFTVPNELYDTFADCLGPWCPCYVREGDAEWCYRGETAFPLNKEARGDESIYL